MAPSLWIKLSVDFYMNPRVLEAGNEAVLLWIRGLCHSKQHMRDGLVPSSTIPMLAFGLGDGMALARRLVECGLWEEAAGGFRINPEKWAVWQQTREDIDRRANAARKAARTRWDSQPDAGANADRMRHGCETQCDSDAECMTSAMQETETETETETEKNYPASPSGLADREPATKKEKVSAIQRRGAYTPDFEAFWEAYPLRKDKGAAFEAWSSLKPSAELASRIVAAARAYAAECQRDRTEARFIKHGSTWLNKRCFDDDLAAGGPGGTAPAAAHGSTWRAILASGGISPIPSEVEAVFASVDKNGNGPKLAEVAGLILKFPKIRAGVVAEPHLVTKEVLRAIAVTQYDRWPIDTTTRSGGQQ